MRWRKQIRFGLRVGNADTITEGAQSLQLLLAIRSDWPAGTPDRHGPAVDRRGASAIFGHLLWPAYFWRGMLFIWSSLK